MRIWLNFDFPPNNISDNIIEAFCWWKSPHAFYNIFYISYVCERIPRNIPLFNIYIREQKITKLNNDSCAASLLAMHSVCGISISTLWCMVSVRCLLDFSRLSAFIVWLIVLIRDCDVTATLQTVHKRLQRIMLAFLICSLARTHDTMQQFTMISMRRQNHWATKCSSCLYITSVFLSLHCGNDSVIKPLISYKICG